MLRTAYAEGRRWRPVLWGHPREPTGYAAVEVRMDAAQALLDAHRAAGLHLTPTHLVAKAGADALARHPEANVLLRFGRPYRRRRVTVCALVAQPPGAGTRRADLTNATVHDADRLPLAAFSRELEQAVRRVRERRDRVIERGKRRGARVPGLLMPWTLGLLSFAWYTLNLDLRWAGMPHDPFGGLAVTSVGSLGLERAFVALADYTRVPLVLAPGRVREVPVVDARGALVPGLQMALTLTYDARLIPPPLATTFLLGVQADLESPPPDWREPPISR